VRKTVASGRVSAAQGRLIGGLSADRAKQSGSFSAAQQNRAAGFPPLVKLIGGLSAAQSGRVSADQKKTRARQPRLYWSECTPAIFPLATISAYGNFQTDGRGQ